MVLVEGLPKVVLFCPGVVEPRGGQVVIHVYSVRQDAALLSVQEAEKTRSRSNI